MTNLNSFLYLSLSMLQSPDLKGYKDKIQMINIDMPNFSHAAVLVVGDVMLDRYWFGDTTRISPEAPVPVVRVKQIDDRPGGAGNVALNIAALGAKVTLLGVSGDDDAARILSKQLTASGVNSRIQHIPQIPTITKLRIISRHQQLLRLDFEEKFPAFNPKDLIATYKDVLKSTNLVILSDYAKGTVESPQEFIRLAHEAGIPILVDPKGADFTIYKGADCITPNLHEFEVIVGQCQNELEIVQKAKIFLKNYDIKALLLTRGEHGMTLIEQDREELHLPAHAREVFDVTGAGDTVISVLGAALAAGSPLPQAMILANLGASLVVAKLGAATISAPELQAALTDASAHSDGIVNDDQLLLAVSDARLRGKKVVFTNGCFDILHAGHVKYLQQAKQLGDYLIVAINDDDSITRLKGSGRPINSVDQRMAVLAGLGVVDWVVSYSDDTPKRLLKLLHPDVLVKGGDYNIDGVVGAEIVQAYGGDVRVLSIVKGISTTEIIDRMIKSVAQTQHIDTE